MADDNPFAPSNAAPAASGDLWAQPDDLELLKADRFQRWLGAFVDGLLPLVVALPFVGLVPVLDLDDTDAITGLFYMGYIAGLFLFGVVNWFLIVQRGQSLGKMAAGTRIVGEDGGPVDFVRGVILRNWVMVAANMFCSMASLIDALFIFGDERQCLHDKLAKTIVVNASSWNPYDA